MSTLLGKRGFDDTEERILAAVGGVSLKRTRNDIAPNPCVIKEIGYQAMYARNLRLMSELGAANRTIIDLEDKLRRLKREYDDLSGRHMMMIQETQGNPKLWYNIWCSSGQGHLQTQRPWLELLGASVAVLVHRIPVPP